MLKLFFVFTIYIYNVHACQKNYCEICSSHTLCEYKISGPSSMCLGYDHNALLTESNIKSLIEHINRRRNFIALGRSQFLPGAANMKKITWSQDLAISAQRWVDQCDPALRPDKEDKCRDLENIKVGQNIASIIGPSSGFNIKSFVEMWFMESLDYDGSVTYYNESRGYKSNRFTQLIWANTEKIGCGKAKFIVKNFKTTIVERLVCNFATRGNVHGKPVYLIGYAATQCLDDMQKDIFFTGLCSRPVQTNEVLDNKNSYSDRIITVTPLATSLLRIRNLFNDSAKKEIDPVYSNIKQMEERNGTEEWNGCSRNNKTPSSTIMQDILFDAVKRSHSLENENFWINHRNNSQNHIDNSPRREKGHSRVYHGHDYKNEFDSIHPETFTKDSRRHDFVTTLSTNHKNQCTRNIGSRIFKKPITDCIPCKQKMLKCTRGQKNRPHIVTRVCEEQYRQTTVQDVCRCNNLQTTCPSVNRCIQDSNCECVSINCPIKHYPNMLRTLGDPANSDIEKRNDFNYNNPFSYKGSKPRSKILPIMEQEKCATYESFRKSDNQNIKLFDERIGYNPNYSDLKRSIPVDDLNFKPFWETDGYSNKKKPQIKSIIYTTLANKKNKKIKKTKATLKSKVKTEHITLKLNIEQNGNIKRVTEKYLSFDELMHLRKINTGNFSGRRLHDINPDDDEGKKILRDSDTPSDTSGYTANTPFIRMKHCTRKLTCTWTAASLTDSAGSIIPGGAGGAAGHMGSRTPPGYVEGCTRTSTCTRDYMNRNKMATIQIETTTPEFDTGDDEDYCERRSLNRRNSNESVSTEKIENNTYLLTNISLNSSVSNELQHINETLNDCICYNNNIRHKRNNRHKVIEREKLLNYKNVKRENIKRQSDFENNVLSYGDLYYYVVQKIINMWKNTNTECLCNNTNKMGCYNLLIYMSIFIFL